MFHVSDHYEMSLLNGMLYGALLLYALHCGSSMHAGIIRDITQGTMIETCYTTYFFIKVNVGFSITYYHFVLFYLLGTQRDKNRIT